MQFPEPSRAIPPKSIFFDDIRLKQHFEALVSRKENPAAGNAPVPPGGVTLDDVKRM